MPTSLLDKITPEILGAVLAMIIATLRVIYGRTETKPLRIGLEALLCGGLSLTASYAISAMGLSSDWSVFTGGVIGYLGSATVHTIALKLIKSRVK